VNVLVNAPLLSAAAKRTPPTLHSAPPLVGCATEHSITATEAEAGKPEAETVTLCPFVSPVEGLTVTVSPAARAGFASSSSERNVNVDAAIAPTYRRAVGVRMRPPRGQ
jgi:hypothetical protein